MSSDARRPAGAKHVVMVADVNLNRADATRTHTVEVARFLATGGCHVDVITFGSGPALPGVRFRMAGPDGLRAFARVAALNAAALTLLWSSRRRGSVCYVRHYWSLVPVYLCARALGYRVVSQVDDMTYGRGYTARPPGLRPWLTDHGKRVAAGVMVRASHAVIAVTDGIRRVLVEDFALAPRKAHVLPNGVDVELFTPRDRDESIRRLELDAEREYVVFVGLFAEWVAFDTLLDAFALVAQGRPDARLLLVGDGSERARVEERIRRLHLDACVTVTGFVPERERIVDFLGAATVCVVGHRPEHVARIGVSPVKVAEYFAAGRPVVGIAIPGVAEMIEENGAGVAVPADAQAMADAIVGLLGDPDRAARMGAAAREAADRHYSWRSIVERTTLLFGPPFTVALSAAS